MILTVVRSGGFAGLVSKGELDTSTASDGAAVEDAFRRVDLDRARAATPQPDRYVYRVEVQGGPGADPTELTVAEQDLDGDLAWIVQRVLRGD